MFVDLLFYVLYMLLLPDMLHIMQQESYQNDGMLRWLSRNLKRAFKSKFIILIIVTLVHIVSSVILNLVVTKGIIDFSNYDENTLRYIIHIPRFISLGVLTVSCIIEMIKGIKERKNAKKPLKYTARVKRLIVYNFFTIVILEVLFIQSFEPILGPASLYDPIIFAFLIFTIPFNMIIANWFVSPLESFFANRFMQKAFNKLAKPEYKNLIKIGITGSYGKTSTKMILKTLLEEKYSVLATPGSYNTSMGNVRVIREQLKPEHQVFISEMGARKKRDIREICEFVNPHIGIITSIGAQHLETFKNIDNVAKTKGELLDGVKNKKAVGKVSQYESVIGMIKQSLGSLTNKPKEEYDDPKLKEILEDGAVFLNKDGDKCEELYKNDLHDKKYLFSLDDTKADVYAKNIKTSPDGSEFTVVSKKNKEYTCKTKLLGKHNVQNIICAIAVAEYLGLTKEQIISGVSKIEPIEHRLQLLPTANGTTVIDDAFNSNPIGSKYALEVLKDFKGRKIIITPGMVELGAEEDKLNKEFGKQMADAVDVAILVGANHTKPIQEGLKEEHFDDMNIYVVTSLDEATKKLGEIAKAGDVILFENDLPDSYNE